MRRKDSEDLVRVGPGTVMGNLMRQYWLPAAMSSELKADGEPMRLMLLGEKLIAFRDSHGRVGVMDHKCPHRCASLFLGRNEEGGLRCVYHGWKFDVEGNCVDMPNEPAESNFKHKIRTTAYPCREWGGLIWAYMGPPERMPEQLPQAEWALVPDSHRFWGKLQIDCNYLAPMEGEVDNTHVAYLHWTLSGGLPNNGTRTPNKHSMIPYIKDRQPRGVVKETPYG